jgi:hypothetical protein
LPRCLQSNILHGLRGTLMRRPRDRNIFIQE